MRSILKHNVFILMVALFAWSWVYVIFGKLVPELIVLPILFLGIFIWEWHWLK